MLVRQIINEGVEELIWSEGFNPGDTDDFEKYLMTRFKNEKSMSKKRMLEESALSISSLMSSTLDQDVLEDVIIFGNENDVILFFCFQICLNMKDIV